ncbi:hypothetical protein PAPHI01_1192 [Pancytospora philotis]|nr:hypothetical protein PAPHI01_1192 [Pancytospora philotis]
MPDKVVISLSQHLPASDGVFRIVEDSILRQPCSSGQYAYCSQEEIEEHLYKIMEKHDCIASFAVYVDDLAASLDTLCFLRDQNPRKEILLYVFSSAYEGDWGLSADLSGATADEMELFEIAADIATSLRFVKPPAAGV